MRKETDKEEYGWRKRERRRRKIIKAGQKVGRQASGRRQAERERETEKKASTNRNNFHL